MNSHKEKIIHNKNTLLILGDTLSEKNHSYGILLMIVESDITDFHISDFQISTRSTILSENVVKIFFDIFLYFNNFEFLCLKVSQLSLLIDDFFSATRVAVYIPWKSKRKENSVILDNVQFGSK